MEKTTVRVTRERQAQASKLIGYNGCRSFEEVVDKALEAYIRLNEKELKAIRRGK